MRVLASAVALLLSCALWPSLATAAPPPAPRIEVAFVLDATGSMGPYIVEARQRIRSVAESLAAGDPAPQVRFALVAYRDHGDAFVTRVDPFTADIDTMRAHLDRTEAAGGGDTPEAVLEGLHAAVTELGWSQDREVLRLIYLVGDAAAQERAGGPTEASVAAAARERGIVIHTIVCGSSLGERGEKTWDRLARYTEGRTMRLAEARAGVAAAPPTTFAAAVGDTARAYSGSVGVDYDSAPELATEPLASAATATGLLGAHARWVRDPLTWSDLWAAHTSVLPAADRPPLPEIDFSTHHVLVAGGRDAGLSLEGVRGRAGARAATLSPVEAAGVRFWLVPAAAEGGAK